MRFVFLSLFTITLAVLASPVEGQIAVPQRARKALEQSSVMIYFREPARSVRPGEDPQIFWCGTGFLIEDGRYLFTSYHVAGREPTRDDPLGIGRQMEFLFESLEGPVRVNMNQTDASRKDLTLFRVRSSPISGLHGVRRFDDLEEGEMLYTFGNRGCNPWTWGSGPVVSKLTRRSSPKEAESIFESIDQFLADGEREYNRHDYDEIIISTSALSAPGNSGGAVVDSAGRLVGVVWAGSGDLSLIIPMKHVYGTLNRTVPLTTTVGQMDEFYGLGQGGFVDITDLEFVQGPKEESSFSSVQQAPYELLPPESPILSALVESIGEPNLLSKSVLLIRTPPVGLASAIIICHSDGVPCLEVKRWEMGSTFDKRNAYVHTVGTAEQEISFLIIPSDWELDSAGAEFSLETEDGRAIAIRQRLEGE